MQNCYRAYYSLLDRVIYIDYEANIILTEAIFTEVLKDVEKLSQTLPNKVFVIANMQNSTFDADLKKNFGKYYADLLKFSRGILRYNVSNLLMQVTIRATTIKNHLQNFQSHIYNSREEALAAVRLLEQSPADF